MTPHPGFTPGAAAAEHWISRRVADYRENLMENARTNLASRAMLVRLQTGSWNGATIDDTVTEEVRDAHDAEDRHGKYTKFLLSPDALKEVNGLRREAHLYHFSVTLPWQEPWRLLPVVLYDEYKARMRGIQDSRIRARQELVNEYEQWKSEARDRLGTMFDESEYPVAEKLADRYYIRVLYNPVPDKKHFVADLPDEQREELAEQIQKQINERIAGANYSLYVRLRELVDQASRQLAKGTFREKLFERIEQLLDVLPKLNLTDDSKLTEMGNSLREAFKRVADVNQLREARKKQYVPALAAEAKEAADNLGRQLQGYFGEPPDEGRVTETGE